MVDVRRSAFGDERKEAAIPFRHHLSVPWAASGENILVIGDAMLDVYVLGSVDRISPEAPVPVIRQTQVKEMGGGGANVAANIVGLGGTAHLIACAAPDDEGRRLAAALSGAGVSFDLLDVDGRPTTVKTRFFAGQHQLLRLDKEEASQLSLVGEQAAIDAIGKRIPWARLVIVSDYGKGMLTDRVLAHTMEVARAAGTPVVVDPKRRDLSAYRGATFTTPNRKELEAATGMAISSDIEAERAGLAAAVLTGGSILVTRSEAGMSLVSPGGEAIHMPTQARAVFDVAGAGDTAAAAFALGLASGRPVAEAMAFANLAAGIAVSKPGTTVVEANDLEAERALLAADGLVDKGALADRETALRLRRLWKHQGLIVGFTNGCFDLLHPGHVTLLREAANGCDRLIVGLNSDASVRRLKGSRRPVQGERERAAVLGAIDNVSIVVIFEQDTPAELIELLLPDLLVKGADYEMDEIVGAKTVIQSGGRVMRVNLAPGHSTTRLIANSVQND